MSAPFIVTNRHLGDTLGVYLDTPYIGLVFELPFTTSWADTRKDTFTFLIKTKYVETFEGWDGHPVVLNGIEIGRIKDSKNAQGNIEATRIEVKASEHPEAFKKDAQNTLRISVDKKNQSGEGLLDDFILTDIETENFGAVLGWVYQP